MTNKEAKVLTSLTIKEMPIKATVGYHYTLTRMVKMKKMEKYQELMMTWSIQKEHLCMTGRNAKWYRHFREQAVCNKVRHAFTLQPSNRPILNSNADRCSPKDMHKNVYSSPIHK